MRCWTTLSAFVWHVGMDCVVSRTVLSRRAITICAMKERIKMSEELKVPNPGSKEALVQGCICPVLDNEHGKGVYQNEKGEWQFWINTDCPLHGKAGKDE